MEETKISLISRITLFPNEYFLEKLFKLFVSHFLFKKGKKEGRANINLH